MEEAVRWVLKDVAARELEVSLSTLDRKIRQGEVEVLREGRQVYVRVDGPEYLSDEELLLRARNRADELEDAVRRWVRIASELDRERDEVKHELAPYLHPTKIIQYARVNELYGD